MLSSVLLCRRCVEAEEYVIDVSEKDCGFEVVHEGGVESNLFPAAHEEASVIGGINFAHGSAFDLEDPQSPKGKVVASEGDAEEVDDVTAGPFRIWMNVEKV